ncbi:MAG: hypothetical protein WAX89_01560 [Alphaproteobacteria bacterium]
MRILFAALALIASTLATLADNVPTGAPTVLCTVVDSYAAEPKVISLAQRVHAVATRTEAPEGFKTLLRRFGAGVLKLNVADTATVDSTLSAALPTLASKLGCVPGMSTGPRTMKELLTTGAQNKADFRAFMAWLDTADPPLAGALDAFYAKECGRWQPQLAKFFNFVCGSKIPRS